jgi:hypothetical protein
MPYIDRDDEVKDGEHVRVLMHMMDATQRAIAGIDLNHHRPGFRHASDAAVRDARTAGRDAYVRDLTSAWRGAGDNPDRAPLPQAPGMAAPAKEPEPLPDPDLAEIAYQQYRRRLAMAWQFAPSATPWEAPPADLLQASRVARLIAQAPPPRASSAPLVDPRATSEIAKLLVRREFGTTAGGPGPTDARAEMISKLRDAWRGPANDRGEPDISTRPEEMRGPRSETDPRAAKQVEREREHWLGADPKQLAADLEKSRARIDAEHRATLSNAWRMGAR